MQPVVVGVAASAVMAAAAPVRLTLVDVGYGSAVLVQDSTGVAVLVDGGFREEEKALREALLQAGVDSLAVMVATHGHGDHLEGLTLLLEEGFPIGAVVGNVPHGHPSFAPSFWEHLGALPYRQVRRGDVVEVGAMTLRVLHPDTLTDDPNNSSMVVLLHAGNVRVMLPADIGPMVQDLLVGRGEDLKADLLLAPHHGDEVTMGFWEAVDPSWVLLSVGPNPWDLPQPGFMEEARKRPMVDTRIDGTVVLRCDGGGITIVSRGRQEDASPRRERDMEARLRRWRGGQ